MTTASLPILASDTGLQKYLREIAQFPVLTLEQEQDYAKRWQEAQDVKSAHRLVTSHLRLVAKIALKYRGYGLPMSELIAEGNIGLMQAVKRFDYNKGFRLSTYAMWWIKAAIQEYILKSWSLVKIGTSATQKRLFFNLRRLKKKIGVLDGHAMTNEQVQDIAGRLEVNTQDVIDMNQRMTASDVFLNSPVAADAENTKMDFLAEPGESQEELLAEKQELTQRRSLLKRALDTLKSREKHILVERRLKDSPTTLEELSQIYNISRERVRQIEARAFEKLQLAIQNDTNHS